MRLPLATDLKARVGTPDKDARVKNGIIEIRGNSSVVRQRPGVSEALATTLGLYAQGGMQFGDSLYVLDGDVIYEYSSSFIFLGGYNIGSGSSVSFSASGSYATGDIAYLPGDPNPWHAVQPVSGVTPGWNSAAYPYWSRYRDKPVGTHPTASATFGTYTSYNDVHNSGIFWSNGEFYLKANGVVFATYTSTADGYDPSHGFGIGQVVTYVDYPSNIGYFVQTGTSPGTVTTWDILVAAQDYCRSVLA